MEIKKLTARLTYRFLYYYLTSNCAERVSSANLMFTSALLDACELSLIGLPSLSITREKPRSRTLLKLAASRSLPDDINLVCFLSIRFSIRFLNSCI